MGHTPRSTPYGPMMSRFIGLPAPASPYESSPGGPLTSISPPQPGFYALGSLPHVAWPMMRNNQPRVSQASPVPVDPSRPITTAKRDRGTTGLDDDNDLEDEKLQPSDSTNNREQSNATNAHKWWVRRPQDARVHPRHSRNDDPENFPTCSDSDTDYPFDPSESYETASSREFETDDPHKECTLEPSSVCGVPSMYRRIAACIASESRRRIKTEHTTLSRLIDRLEEVCCECRPEAENILDLICSAADHELYEIDAAVRRR
ncbi:hypothetical protein CspHIS471_0608930 [Cutaneotrichosporon sp. HIS471]|nr:hypothetical protein CspHIS471_0608930 [Cutaneotrichosporon sp. HIS471]